MFKDRIYRFIIYPLIGLILYLLLTLSDPLENFIDSDDKYSTIDSFLEIFYIALFSFGTIQISMGISLFLNKFYFWEKNALRRFLIQIFLQIIFVLLLILFTYYFIHKQFFPSSILMTNLSIRRISVIGVLLSLLVTTIFTADDFLTQLNNAKINAIQYKQTITQSQLDTLRSHIAPHFLFNNFSTLSALIEENQEKATFFLQQLSTVYRYILSNLNNDVVPLDSELDFIDAYIHLYKVRFGDNVILKKYIDITTADKKIATGALQILIENVIKHNTISNHCQVKIAIYNQGNFIVVSNNKHPKKNSEFSTKLGLINIVERYKLLHKELPIIENNPTTFTVKIPLIV